MISYIYIYIALSYFSIRTMFVVLPAPKHRRGKTNHVHIAHTTLTLLGVPRPDNPREDILTYIPGGCLYILYISGGSLYIIYQGVLYILYIHIYIYISGGSLYIIYTRGFFIYYKYTRVFFIYYMYTRGSLYIIYIPGGFFATLGVPIRRHACSRAPYLQTSFFFRR